MDEALVQRMEMYAQLAKKGSEIDGRVLFDWGHTRVDDELLIALGAIDRTSEMLFHTAGDAARIGELRIQSTLVTDAGMAPLAKLSQLARLNVSNTAVGDAGLAAIGRIATLVQLRASGTRVTDAGLVHLAGLTRLEELHLNDTKIGDAGLEHLVGLSTLRLLVINRSKVTESGVKKLRERLPSLVVQHHRRG